MAEKVVRMTGDVGETQFLRYLEGRVNKHTKIEILDQDGEPQETAFLKISGYRLARGYLVIYFDNGHFIGEMLERFALSTSPLWD